MPTLFEQFSNGMADMVSHVRHRLVQITDGTQGIGAGTIWHPQGLIVTNAHVASRDQLWVTLPDEQTLPATVIARDVQQDLAALIIEAHDLPSIELGNSRDLEAGQWVMALGHPWGEIGAATAGVVIAHEQGQDEREWIMVNLRLRPGHSGGPLVDTQGRLVGINTLMNGPEVGAAVPVHIAKDFLQRRLSV